MSNELFDFDKKSFAEIHIFVADVDFEVIDVPIEHAYPRYELVEARVLYWKKMGFDDVHYEFVRVIEKLVVKEVKENEKKPCSSFKI